MPVRSARLDEIDKFYEMWEEFLEEHHPKGGVLVNARSLDQGTKLFHTYVSGARNGSCYFWCDDQGVPQGFFLAGEPLGYFDMFDDLEKCFIVYGVYIRKTHRKGSAGKELAYEAAVGDRAKGTVTGVTVVKAGNDRGQSLIDRVGANLIDLRFSFGLQDVIDRGV